MSLMQMLVLKIVTVALAVKLPQIQKDILTLDAIIYGSYMVYI